MGTKVGIVYSRNSKIVRRICYRDDDAHLSSLNLHPLEAVHITESAILHSHAERLGSAAVHIAAQSVIKEVHGIDSIPSARTCVIDAQGNVVDVIMADAEVDTIPDHILVHHDKAAVGWRWDRECGFSPL